MAFGWEGGIPVRGSHPSPLERFGVPDLVFLLHRDHSAAAQVEQVRSIVDEHGRAGFVAYGRAGRRVCRKLRDLLPAGYQAMVEEPNPEGGGPGALLRYRHFQTRLWVSRVGGPDSQPRAEHPHQRALDGLNRPTPPERNLPGRQTPTRSREASQ